jgi:hypothetical protein
MVNMHPSRYFAMLAIAVVSCCAPLARGQDSFELNEQTFNQWLFSASQGVFNPDTELTLNVEAVDRVCGLSEPQKKKLRLAGRGDYARFGRQVDELKTKYVGKTYGQNEVGEIYQKIQPLGQLYQAGLLGNDSLFSKVLAKTLTSEQAVKLDHIETERRRARYAAKVGLFVVILERSCPLTDKQRTALVDLIMAETKAPKRFGQYDWYAIMYQAGKVPDAKYEQIVDEAQMRALKKTLQQGAGMEHFLRQQKIIDE